MTERVGHGAASRPSAPTLRTSAAQRGAAWARAARDASASGRGLRIATRYVEGGSGAKLHWPGSFHVLADSRPVDLLLAEEVDRSARPSMAGRIRSHAGIDGRQIRIVVLDLPITWRLAGSDVESTDRVPAAVDCMLPDMLGAIARKDHEDLRRRQQEGTAEARAAGPCKDHLGRRRQDDGIAAMLRARIPGGRPGTAWDAGWRPCAGIGGGRTRTWRIGP